MTSAARAKNDKGAIAAVLRRTRPFADVPETVIARFCEVGEFRSYKDGQCIARFGDPPMGVLVIAEGCIETSRVASNGKRLVYDYSQPGQVTGLFSTFDGGGFPLDNIACGPTRLLVIPGNVFVETVRSEPAFALALIEMFVRRGRLDFEHILLSVDTMRVKVAKYLLFFSRGPRPANGPVAIPIRMSQEAIAGLVGASRQTINKELVKMAREGILSWQQGNVTILDIARLRTVALGGAPDHGDLDAIVFERSTKHFPKTD